MKRTLAFCAALLLVTAALGHAADPAKGAKPDEAAMMEQMAKMTAPGPEHEIFKKLEGEWDLAVTSQMDPSAPAQKSQSTSSVKLLMDGRYCQEQSTGTMGGMTFNGMGITGYDKVVKKYETIWLDNMGTGIMKSVGIPDKDGKTINWTASAPDPMSGKMIAYRMVSRIVDDNHHTFEMYQKNGGKEFKAMTIEYTRKM